MSTRESYQIIATDLTGTLLRLNSVLARISDRLDKIEGIRGGSNIESDLDMNDNTINNVSLDATDISVVDMTMTGDFTFSGEDSGLTHGSMSIEENSAETAIASSGVDVQVTVFDTIDHQHHVAADLTESHMTIERAGHYLISLSATIDSVTGAASKAEISIKKNNGASNIVPHVDRNLAGGGGTSGVISISGIALLAVGDTIEMWIKNETNTQNYVVEDVSLAILQIGGA